MTRGRYLLYLAVVISLLPLAMSLLGQSFSQYLVLGREGTAVFIVSVCIVSILALALMRCEAAGFSVVWLAPVFLWLAASEPIIRGLAGMRSAASDAAPLSNAGTIFLTLVVFMVFLGVRQRPQGAPLFSLPRCFELAAAALAAMSIVLQPYLIMRGVDAMPLFGQLIDWPVWFTRAMDEMQKSVADQDGLIPGLGVWGNGLFLSAFTFLLVAIWFADLLEGDNAPSEPQKPVFRQARSYGFAAEEETEEAQA